MIFRKYTWICYIFVLKNGTLNSLNPNRKDFDKRVINCVNICIQSRCDVYEGKRNIRRKNVYVWNHLDLQKGLLSIAPYPLWHKKAHTIPLYTYKAVYCLSATHRLCQKKPQQQIIYEACFCLLDSTLSR